MFFCSLTKDLGDKRRSRGVSSALAILIAFGVATPALGQSSGLSAEEVARELANPNNALANLTFKNQYRWYEGSIPDADSQDNYTLLFQPVFPFPLGTTESGGKANLFIRPGIPLLVNQPTFSGLGFDGVTALGDTGFDVGYGVNEANGVIWGVGMVGTLPTATDSRVAGHQLRLGPEALIAKFETWGLYGIFPSHQWDVAGCCDSHDYNVSQIQLAFTYLPGGGWSIGSSPIMNYDWNTHDWSIPLNLTVSKTVTMGDIPVKLALEANYYVVRPELFGTEWMVAFNITPVVPNFIADLFQ